MVPVSPMVMAATPRRPLRMFAMCAMVIDMICVRLMVRKGKKACKGRKLIICKVECTSAEESGELRCL